MDKIQSQQLDQFQSTDLVLEGADNIWNLPAYAKFVNNAGEFRFQLADIEKYKILQVTDVHGAADYARLARLDMAAKSKKVRSAVQNWASDHKDTKLYQQVRFAESRLTTGMAQRSFSYALSIKKQASLIIDDLLAYKLTPEELDLFSESIKTAATAHSDVNFMRKQRKVATAELKKLFPATRETIETKLRPGATQFMDTAPDFYNELIASFEINDYATHFTEFDIETRDKATGIVLGGVKITATSLKGAVMQQFSTPDGAADFIQFTPTWWTLTYECPGYEKLVMPDRKAEKGKKMSLVAELVKIA
jgi:hypothetical protein